MKRQPDPGPSVKERARAAYLALALGDALGATTEFLTAEEIKAKHGLHKEIVGGGWLRLKPGQVTDDTEMNLYLGRALVLAGGFHLSAVADQWVQWMRSKPVDMGATVRQGLRAYRINGVTEQAESEWMGGNGAAMRNLPVILANLTEPERMQHWSLKQAWLTHRHPVADQGLLLLAELSRLAILQGQEAPLKTVAQEWSRLSKKWDHTRFKRSIDGYIVNTVKTVLFFFFRSTSLEDCLVQIANAGGDADTNAAIAGMIAGPFYGMEGLPKRWLKRLDQEVKNEIDDQIDALWEIFYE